MVLNEQATEHKNDKLLRKEIPTKSNVFPANVIYSQVKSLILLSSY